VPHILQVIKKMNDPQNKTQVKRRALIRRVVLAANLSLACILGFFIIWNSYVEWHTHIAEKKNALENESRILIRSVVSLKHQGRDVVENFINSACGAMQESTSPGHHIAVLLDDDVIQAKAHHRASPELFAAMQNAIHNPKGIASIEQRDIVVGISNIDNVTVYVSEYLSDIRQIIITQVTRSIVSIILVGLTIAIVLNIILHRMIALPLNAMVDIVRQFAYGRRDCRMPDVNTNELGALADEFNHMAAVIETAEKDRNARLEKARQIQQNLFPDISSVKDVEIACLFYPASEAGADYDYYDVIRLKDNSILLCVVDVIGYDVPAAMSAAMLKALIKEAAEEENDLSKLISQVHVAFSEVMPESDYATMFLARWSVSERLLYYANAGQELGYLVKSNAHIEQLNVSGPILGLESSPHWTQQSVNIDEGDRLILLTDGVTETVSPQGEPFGRERTKQIIEKYRQQPVEEFAEHLINYVTRFRGSGPQLDDITVMAVDLL